MTETVVPGNLEGHHTVDIVMSNSFMNDMNVNYQSAVWTPLMPVVTLSGGRLDWEPVEGAVIYDVYAGGERVAGVASTEIFIEDEWDGDIQVIAVAADGTPSFPSEPVNMNEKICRKFPEVKLTKQSGRVFSINVDIPESGEWSLSWNYANGSGPVNTDNNCGIRMLYVDGVKAGINIFPHRGTNEWDNWGWTVPEKLELSRGTHTFVLKWESDADNMDQQINDFQIRAICLTKL